MLLLLLLFYLMLLPGAWRMAEDVCTNLIILSKQTQIIFITIKFSQHAACRAANICYKLSILFQNSLIKIQETQFFLPKIYLLFHSLFLQVRLLFSLFMLHHNGRLGMYCVSQRREGSEILQNKA